MGTLLAGLTYREAFRVCQLCQQRSLTHAAINLTASRSIPEKQGLHVNFYCCH